MTLDLLEQLKTYRGLGTSMVSVIARAGTLPGDLSKRINNEISAASNIKDRRNRHSVLEALKSINQYTKQHVQLPVNGVAIFSGRYV